MEQWQHETYLLQARLPIHKKRIASALTIVRKALVKLGVWAVSFSGGKDGVVLLDIAIRAGWRGPLFHFWYDETPGENTEMAKRMANKHDLELHLLQVPGAWDVYRKVGHFFVQPVTADEKRATNNMLRQYKKAVNTYVRENDWYGNFMGLRTDESRARSLMLNRKGPIYFVPDRDTWTACPLIYWKSEDVWAYILENNLPYLKCYDTARDPERMRSETTWLAAESIWRYGMAARLKREQPEEFARIAEHWPEIQRYT